MSAEESYRSALRWYPKRWRRENGEVLVGTLLDAAEAEGRTEPAPGELRDLRRAGLGARADLLLPGPVRERTAALAVGALLAFGLVLITAQAWTPWEPGSSYVERQPPEGVIWQLMVQPAISVLAAVAALAGWGFASRILAIASLPALGIPIALTTAPFLLRPSLATLALLGALAVLALVGRPVRRWLLISAAVSLAGIVAWLAFVRPFGERYFPRGGLVDLIGGPWPVVALLAVIVVFAIRRDRAGAVAVLVFAVPWLVLRTVDVLWLSVPFGWQLTPVAVVGIPLVVGGIIAITGRRRRKEPAPPVR